MVDIPDPATTNWVPIWNPLVAGPPGPAGPGVPTGGAAGQVLTKNSPTDFDTAWLTPTTPAHHTTHELGGSDVVNLDASQITTGTLADARLSSNVALKNVNNGFTTSQNITGNLTASGSVFERGRLVAMGEWQAFSLVMRSQDNNFSLGNASVITRYTLIGKTCHFTVRILFGSTTAFGTGYYVINLPVTPLTVAEMAPGQGIIITTAGYDMVIGHWIGASEVRFLIPRIQNMWGHIVPSTAKNGDYFFVNGTYEIA